MNNADITGESAIRACLHAIDAYLSRFDGDGVRDVRAGISRWGSGAMRLRASQALAPELSIETALDYLRQDGEAQLASAIAAAAAVLPWQAYALYAPEEIGPAFTDGHAFVSIIGVDGVLHAEDFDLGLFIIAPHIFYRDHKHAAPELYVPLTGPHGWRFAPDTPLIWKAAHEPVWNEPWQPHATKIGAVPFLCIFGWTRDVQEPAVIVPSSDWSVIELVAACRSADVA